jgi:Eco57I restriction-modification methylase
MAFDQATRNKLQNFVTNARALLKSEFTRQLQKNFGMDPITGEISNLDSLTHLNDTQIRTARLLRDTLNHYQTTTPLGETSQILGRIVREQGFTVLNRLCALRMAEARGILIESIQKGYHSKGFSLYARMAGTALGETGDTYQNYLFSLFDEFSYDLPVLFDRYSPLGRLFPRESALLELLDKINDPELAALWAEDETIGWIYQYFNSVEERRQMRADSSAPRNSRELAMRNQFFTPRYVVEFLTDNTLGRIWYEMTCGHTGLTEQCRYLVRRPNEIFLKRGEGAPEPESKSEDTDLSQEELLKQAVYILHRPMKDPRKILMLDPACGSMHFGLYAFDLFEKIYKEAWELQSTGQWPMSADKRMGLLTEKYATREELLRDIPRLIIEHNIHGVDIDPRAVQIAGLSLWLRAQRSWKEHQINPKERSRILKSNIVCAEPMPGDATLLNAFSKKLKHAVLGQLLEIIVEKMELAGEAGSLLKIEQEIETAVEQAREEFNKEILRRNQASEFLPGMAPKQTQPSLFDFADLPSKTQFWETAEENILDALKEYAEHTEEGDGGRRRLFVEDAAKGFAFIDLCRKRYDVVLMNPPFGGLAKSSKPYLSKYYSETWNDIYGAFKQRALNFLFNHGMLGSYGSK